MLLTHACVMLGGAGAGLQEYGIIIENHPHVHYMSVIKSITLELRLCYTKLNTV